MSQSASSAAIKPQITLKKLREVQQDIDHVLTPHRENLASLLRTSIPKILVHRDGKVEHQYDQSTLKAIDAFKTFAEQVQKEVMRMHGIPLDDSTN